jgi:hypothetical protein
MALTRLNPVLTGLTGGVKDRMATREEGVNRSR